MESVPLRSVFEAGSGTYRGYKNWGAAIKDIKLYARRSFTHMKQDIYLTRLIRFQL